MRTLTLIGLMWLFPFSSFAADSLYQQQQEHAVQCLKKQAPDESPACDTWRLALLCAAGEKKIAAGDVQGGLPMCREAADKGLVSAQVTIGQHYLKGLGSVLKKDFVLARQWIAKGAAAGHPKALLLLGLMYYNGDGGPKDADKAVKLMIASGHTDYLVAQKKLTQMYLEKALDPKTKRITMPEGGNVFYWACLAATHPKNRANAERDLCDALKMLLPPDTSREVSARIQEFRAGRKSAP